MIDLHRQCWRKVAKSGRCKVNDIPCNKEMNLVLDNHGCMTWVCPVCYPKFPERSLPYPKCPKCGKETKRRYDGIYECKDCDRNWQPRPWDLFFKEERDGYIPVYEELVDDDVWHWWDRTMRYVGKYEEREENGERKSDS